MGRNNQYGPSYVHTKVEGDQLKGDSQGIINEEFASPEYKFVNYGFDSARGFFCEEQPMTDEGIKHDEGKDRWDLLPPSISKVVEVYTIGAAKYDDDNWAKGMGYRRIFGAMMRHAWRWFWGESYDLADGQHHLASVAWACLTLMHYEDEGVGTDDRAFKPLEKPKLDWSLHDTGNPPKS